MAVIQTITKAVYRQLELHTVYLKYKVIFGHMYIYQNLLIRRDREQVVLFLQKVGDSYRGNLGFGQ